MATIKIKQIGSPIRRPESQRKILIGLGLNKMHKVVERQDTPEVRGAIAKIPHLVAVVDYLQVDSDIQDGPVMQARMAGPPAFEAQVGGFD